MKVALNKSHGFSLIELLVVLVIMGMLAGLVGPRLFSKVDSSKAKTASTQVKMLRGALQTYRLDVGSYPTTEQGLAGLQSKPAEAGQYWQGPYLSDNVPLDPWNTPYVYASPAQTLQGFALYSLGADKVIGGEALNADIGVKP